ncbi:MAG: hypothetical protein U9R20_03925, partial [Thermodesulfobacteriota bacterium]|nr:hypothetical protein [Thermodesulfobacteriota bacterium]
MRPEQLLSEELSVLSPYFLCYPVRYCFSTRRNHKGSHTINKLHGNTTGLKAGEIRELQRFYRRKMPPERIVTHEFARALAGISRRINRQAGVLVSRRGEVLYVIVGDHRQIVIPDLGGFRSSSARLKGLRLI